ncbi:MAG: hypothetical protein AAFV25_27685, partial [Bacteroidota bacterium]
NHNYSHLPYIATANLRLKPHFDKGTALGVLCCFEQEDQSFSHPSKHGVCHGLLTKPPFYEKENF